MAETVAIKAARVKKVVEMVNCMFGWCVEKKVAEEFGEYVRDIYSVSCREAERRRHTKVEEFGS